MRHFNKTKRGFSLVEGLIGIVLFTVVLFVGNAVLSSGQIIWVNTNTSASLQKNLRNSLERMSKELKQSGNDKNGTPVLQVWINDGAGINGTDILRFSIPIICQTGASVNNSNGNVAYWGGALSWSCGDTSCMDANNDCTVLEYKYIEYLLDTQNRLLRRVLDSQVTPAVVQENVFAENIIDFQVTTNQTNTVYTLQLQTQMKTMGIGNKSLTESLNVFLRNL